MTVFSAAAHDEDGDTTKALRARIQQLEEMLAAVGAGGIGQLMPRNPAACIAREFNTWSPNEGDTWYDDPADAQIIQIMFGIAESVTVGDEYELIAGWTGVTARYRITSVSADGDCEVECISHCLETDAPQLSTVKQTLTVDRQPLTDEQWLKRWTGRTGQRLKPGPERDRLLRLFRFAELAHGIGG